MNTSPHHDDCCHEHLKYFVGVFSALFRNSQDIRNGHSRGVDRIQPSLSFSNSAYGVRIAVVDVLGSCRTLGGLARVSISSAYAWVPYGLPPRGVYHRPICWCGKIQRMVFAQPNPEGCAPCSRGSRQFNVRHELTVLRYLVIIKFPASYHGDPMEVFSMLLFLSLSSNRHLDTS